jgi:DNA-binding CsgD family transcriptional regulator
MGPSERLTATLDLLYASVLERALWPKAAAAVAHFGNARGTFYVTADHTRGVIVQSESTGVDPEAQDLYRTYYAEKEIRLSPALTIPVAQAFTESSLVEKRVYERSEIFNDLLTPFDIPYILGVWVTRRARTTSAFVFERARSQGAYTRSEIETCSALLPHLVRALHAREALAAARQRERIYLDLLDRLAFGTVLLDDTLRVIEVSLPARSHLALQPSSISIVGGRLKAASLADDRRLQRILAAQQGGSLTVGQHAAALNISVLPVRSRESFADVRPAQMVFLLNPHARTSSAVSLVESVFRLTPAEATLACTLFKGLTLREAAREFELSVNTCKSQLKSIYLKTGWRSHVELARALFLALAARPTI